MKTTIIICLFLIIAGLNQTYEAQYKSKKVLKFGIELADYLSANSGSFNKEPGFTFGYLTGIDIYSFSESAIIIGIDVNYTRLLKYRTNVTYIVNYDYKYLRKNDERYRLSLLELGILPEYYYFFNDDFICSVYAGGSAGAGVEKLNENVISSINIGPSPHFDAQVYDGDNLNSYKLPLSIIIGNTLFYKRLMIDFRYRFTSVNSEASYFKNFNSFFMQFGFIL